LLAAVQNYFPGPLESCAGDKTIATRDGTERTASETGPVVAFVFKTTVRSFCRPAVHDPEF
jgi:elongation factor G